jgi:hypothetical protein
MRKGTAFVLLATVVLLIATPVLALEKTAERATAEDAFDAWTLSTTCTVAYYNYCTGWVWNWSGWSPGDVVGVAPWSCCAGGGCSTLNQVAIRIRTGAPTGYNFTGTTEVYCADALDCPTGVMLGQQPYLPTGSWDYIAWGIPVPPHFAVTMTFGPGTGSPVAIRTDHPAAGPTGPQACGYCYPSPRVAYSYSYGTATTPLCPGSPFDDGVCDAELMWAFDITCTPVSVEDETWAGVKSLYR